LTGNGITLHGHASGSPKIMLSGTVQPWSTSIWFMMVMSKSSRIRLWAMCQARSGWPITSGTGRGPHPSSAGLKLSAQPIANVGMMFMSNADAWSLYTRITTSGMLPGCWIQSLIGW
jgi:hypothetical protein